VGVKAEEALADTTVTIGAAMSPTRRWSRHGWFRWAGRRVGDR